MKWLLLLGSFSLGMLWVGELRQEAGQEGPGLAATENGWCGGLTGAKQPGWRVEDPYDEQLGRGPKYPEVVGRKVKGGRYDVYCSTVPSFGTDKRHTDRHRVTCDVFFGIERRLAG